MPNPLSLRSDGASLRFRLVLAVPAEAAEDIARIDPPLARLLDRHGADADERNALHIAIEELITNIGKFGPAGLPAGRWLTVRGLVRVAPATLRLRLVDNGAPFNPAARPPPNLDADLSDRPIGGLGLFMLFQMFHHLHYRHRHGCNTSVWTLRRKGGRLGEGSEQE